VLHRDLKKHEAPEPGPAAVAARHNGEAVYYRAAVRPVHSAWHWKRNYMRVVTPEQVATPCKRIPRRKSAAAAAVSASAAADDAAADDELDGDGDGGGAGGGGDDVPFYGEWQTAAWLPPPLVGDALPTNEHGNLEIWGGNPKCVPPGAAWLPQHGMRGVARKLGIDHVEALTGFEVKSGGSFPVFQGIVVVERHRELLVSAWGELEAVKAEKAAAKRLRVAAGRWEKLCFGLTERARLDATFGAVAGGAGEG